MVCQEIYRRYIAKLEQLMEEGIEENNLPLGMIRKLIRLTYGYIIGYKRGMDMIESDSWLKQYRSHRHYNKIMDKEMEQIYFDEKEEA